jgi:hypothetical protein
MLKPEGYFQMVYLFSVTLEPEMPRFYDPSVDGPYGDFVDLFSLYPIKISHRW